MIRARQPKRDKPAHAMPAHENIHLRLVEHVPHVQPTRHVRRRQEQRKHRTRISRHRSLHVKQFFPDPILGPARFNRARFVSFRQFVRHRVPNQCGDGAPPRPGRPNRAKLGRFPGRRRESLILQAQEKKGQTASLQSRASSQSFSQEVFTTKPRSSVTAAPHRLVADSLFVTELFHVEHCTYNEGRSGGTT